MVSDALAACRPDRFCLDTPARHGDRDVTPPSRGFTAAAWPDVASQAPSAPIALKTKYLSVYSAVGRRPYAPLLSWLPAQ